jgi:hypothetical protein
LIELTEPMVIVGGDGSSIALNGLLMTGNQIEVEGAIQSLSLEHCTLVPGWRLNNDGTPTDPDQPSLIVHSTVTSVRIERSIVGGLRIPSGASLDAAVTIRDSIVDATSPTLVAYADLDGSSAGGTLDIEASTVVGTVHTVLLKNASNAIFMARGTVPVRAERRQQGCVRFSYIPPGSQVPRRYRCQPDLAISIAVAALERARGSNISKVERDQLHRFFESWLVPSCTSYRYGDPAYAQLHRRCPPEITQGADDESEMGAFHHLMQPQREINLRTRLREYLPFGLEAGILYAT